MEGGDGNDIIIGHGTEEILAGGAGNDVIIARADSGESQYVVKVLEHSQMGEEVVEGYRSLPADANLNDYLEHAGSIIQTKSAGASADDLIHGGAGSDLFVFEFTVTTTKDNGTDPALVDDGAGNTWTQIAGLNGAERQHWVDSIGNDWISDFEVGIDSLGFVGHTVAIHSVTYGDFDANGTVDTRIALYSEHRAHRANAQDDHGDHSHMLGDPLAHHRDYLGSVTLKNVEANADELDLDRSILDVPVSAHHDIHGVWAGEYETHVHERLVEYFEAEYGDILPDIATNAMPDDDIVDNLVREFIPAQVKGDARKLDNTFYKGFTHQRAQEMHQIDADEDGILDEWVMNDEVEILNQLITGTASGDNLRPSDLGGRVDAGGGDDMIIGQIADLGQVTNIAANDLLRGDSGNDFLHGGRGHDFLFGGEGDDNLFASLVSSSFDQLFGGDGNDELIAAAGGSGLFGGAGDDRIYITSEISQNAPDDLVSPFFAQGRTDRLHRFNNDVMSGGEGKDTFVFDVLTNSDGSIHGRSGVDTILDFEQGEDRIEINLHGWSENGDISPTLTTVALGGDDDKVATVLQVFSDTAVDISAVPQSTYENISQSTQGAVLEVMIHGITAEDLSLSDLSITISASSESYTIQDFVDDHYNETLNAYDSLVNDSDYLW